MKKKLLFVAAIFIVPVIFIGLRKNSAPFFSVKEYHCTQVQDVFLSDDYFSSINNTFKDLFKERCGAHLIIDRLKQQFLVLKKVVIAYRPSGTEVMISAYEPICLVNNSCVFTEQKDIFPKNLFTEDAIINIPKVEVARDSMKNAPELISHVLQTLPSDTYQMYNLELIHEHCMRFVDKQTPQFTILSSVAQEKLAQLLVQCETIKQTINEKKGFDKGVEWVADTRFAHYIVAYKA